MATPPTPGCRRRSTPCPPRSPPRPPQPVWVRVALIAGLLALTVRGGQELPAIADPHHPGAGDRDRGAARPVRADARPGADAASGLTSRPFWIVSLSVPREEEPQVFDELAVVRVDANTGKVEDVRIQRDAPQPGEG